MNKLKTIRFASLLILSGALNSWAGGAGTTAADILKMGVGARAIGMGEAYTAQADDVHSLYYNPGGLALMQQRQASFMYSQMVQDLKFQHAAIGLPLENGAIGASVSYLGYGDIQGYDTAGTQTGNVGANSMVGTLGAAWLGNLWSAGANVKGIREKLADESATGVAFDVGSTVIYPKPVLGATVRFGAAIQNMGQGMKFLQQRDPLPMQYKVGAAILQLMNKRLNLSLDYTKPRELDGIISTGLEFLPVRFIALRTGFVKNEVEGSGIRAGIGLRVKGVSFDYAYTGQGELGMTHRYELSLKFGEPRPILTPEERKILQQAKAAMRNERYEQATLLFDSLIELAPNYKPARRYVKQSMAKLEQQQGQMLARQGQNIDPSTMGTARRQALPEMDDLEQLLNLGTPRTAEAGKDAAAPDAQPQGER